MILPCPVAEAMCEECFWLSQEVLLADGSGLDDVIEAFEKIARNKEALCEGAPTR